jgi:hypothetical protein
MPVQLRFHTGLTGAEYVTSAAWQLASLAGCPLHVLGGCGFARHGTYLRKSPPGTRIARWYCPLGHCTFSLLPEHLAARFPGTLSEIEQVVATVEQAPSLEAAANRLRRDDVSLPSAVRWTRRRLHLVYPLLTTLIGLLPEVLLGCAPRIDALRMHLACTEVLMSLRERARIHLQVLARPLGFRHPLPAGGERRLRFQQHVGPDPPGSLG